MIYLLAAIASEVCGTLLLRVATFGNRWIFLPVTILYVVSYLFLALTLKSGMPLSIAYGLWAALGLLATTLLSAILFHERISRKMMAGLALITLGVFCVELG
ncbi:QacE family quaternary ammonium compound efflux SMR transporter [Corynebacterium hindlerae]|uniref:QacE family quaternary ammonium compound efflux SMR transporter n=1 Tax=Corynebacterium hindlerae TaxID=699041 RepID=A0A7G5FCM8_9CORY|nr:SMR family transporter [Corynebacterium hindlerae]QMV84369.1 QacE family quaternary ammonium compound efflux SMR transporter [Corynebacterium hindlerae]